METTVHAAAGSDGPGTLHHADCRAILPTLPAHSVDAVITDPPYEWTFMGLAWDATGIARDVSFWREVLRVLKPGGHLLAFGAPRTAHRMVGAIEDAGFEIRDTLAVLRGMEADVRQFVEGLSASQRDVFGRILDHLGFGGCLLWLYGSGWPKSGALGRARASEAAAREAAGDEAGATDSGRSWAGWGLSLKPAHEPIVLARKPLGAPTVAANVLAWRTGALNIDACRIGWPGGQAPTIGAPGWGGPNKKLTAVHGQDGATVERLPPSPHGRWPTNVLLSHDPRCVPVGASKVRNPSGSGRGDEPSVGTQHVYGARHRTAFRRHGDAEGDETVEVWACVPTCPVRIVDAQSGERAEAPLVLRRNGIRRLDGFGFARPSEGILHGGRGGASRFFYCPRASQRERGAENTHPTVKPLALMQYLVRLVTPPGGVVLDPFMGSGTTGVACIEEGCEFIGIEREAAFVEIARARLRRALEEREAREPLVSWMAERAGEPTGEPAEATPASVSLFDLNEPQEPQEPQE